MRSFYFTYRPKDLLARIRWFFDRKTRREVNAYLDQCADRVLAAFPEEERQRMMTELVITGRTRIVFPPLTD